MTKKLSKNVPPKKKPRLFSSHLNDFKFFSTYLLITAPQIRSFKTPQTQTPNNHNFNRLSGPPRPYPSPYRPQPQGPTFLAQLPGGPKNVVYPAAFAGQRLTDSQSREEAVQRHEGGLAPKLRGIFAAIDTPKARVKEREGTYRPGRA